MSRFARRLMFPRHLVSVPLTRRVADCEQSWLDVDAGVQQHERVEVWFLPGHGVSAQTPGPAVIFTHGNGELIDHWPLELAPYRELGVSVVLPEYRGYGRSTGKPSERAILSDLSALLAQLAHDPRVDMQRLIFHGRSLGGGFACGLARVHPPKALILESTFSSMLELTRGMGVPGFLIEDRFLSEPVVRSFRGPILVLHGTQDTLIPKRHAEQLAASNPRAKLVLYEAGHNDLPRLHGYWQHIAQVVEQVRAAGSPL